MMSCINKNAPRYLLVMLIFSAFHHSFSFAQNQENVQETTIVNNDQTTKIAKKRQGPLIIQSQIKGAQEQPNVMYILPWQGIDNPILIDGKLKQIVLPKFHPINPKKFKNQVILFHQQRLTTEKIE